MFYGLLDGIVPVGRASAEIRHGAFLIKTFFLGIHHAVGFVELFFDIAVGTPPAEAYCAVNSVPFHTRAHIGDRRSKAIFIRFVVNDCKFITAHAVGFTRKGLLDMRRCTAQQVVALLVAKLVVYLFQAVYIKIWALPTLWLFKLFRGK